jgi:hypothetical protein
VTFNPALRAIMGALAGVLFCGAVAAQVRYEPHDRGGLPRGEMGRGGFGMEGRAAAPMARPPMFERGPAVGRPPAFERAGQPVGRPPGYERRDPSVMARGVYERGYPPIGRGPGGPVEGAPPYAPPPRYVSPPPRRPYDAPMGWRAAPRPPPGIEGRQPSASLGWVIQSIQRRSPGRQLDADTDYMDGRPVYRVRWLTVHGRRMDYIVDAETGVILSGR